MVAGINIKGEVVAIEMTETSIKEKEFTLFIKSIHRRYRGEGVCVYLDNLRLHYNRNIKLLADSYAIDFIYAPAYSSEWNPVERIWSLAKAVFRKKCLLHSDYSS